MKLSIIAVLLILGLSVVFFSSNTKSCGPDSEAVKYAKSLSQDRLRQLYHDMVKHKDNAAQGLDGFQTYDEKAKIPPEFSDLRVVKVHPRDSVIMVEGCFDEYVYLHISSEKSPKSIILDYPDHKGPYTSETVVLWNE